MTIVAIAFLCIAVVLIAATAIRTPLYMFAAGLALVALILVLFERLR